MAIVLGSNIASRKLVTSLSNTSRDLGRTFERLSSGVRINRSADDPAGQAVSSALQARSRVFSRATLNIADGSSLLNIVDGTLGQASDLLQRMQELAQQAASGALSYSQRSALNKEYMALDKEIRRISDGASFNGTSLLQGSRVVNTIGAALTTNTSQDFLLSADGSYAAYQNTGDNDELRVKNLTTGVVTTVTDVGATQVEAAGVLANGDVVFTSTLGASKNVKIYRQATGAITTLTNSLSASDAASVKVSADGSTVAFTSVTQYTNGGTKSSASLTGQLRIFAVNIDSGIIRGSSSFIQSFDNMAISADGKRLAMIGDRVDGVVQGDQIFTLNFDNATPTYTKATALASGATLDLAGVDVDGTALLVSNRDLLTDASTTVGLYNFWSVSSTGAVKNKLYSDEVNIQSIGLGGDGSVITFTSISDPLGFNPNGARQAFRLDTSTGTLVQLTGFAGAPSMGSAVVFSGDGLTALSDQGANVNLINLVPSSKTFDFEVGNGRLGGINAVVTSFYEAMRGLSGYTITSKDFAAAAVDRISLSLESLNLARGNVGAAMSRLEVTASLVDSQNSEIDIAHDRIRNIDVAQESASMVRLKILSNATTALLAQANQQPKIALSLLESSFSEAA